MAEFSKLQIPFLGSRQILLLRVPQGLRISIQKNPNSITDNDSLKLRLWTSEFMGSQVTVNKPITVSFLCRGLVARACLERGRPTVLLVNPSSNSGHVTHKKRSPRKRWICNPFPFPPLLLLLFAEDFHGQMVGFILWRDEVFNYRCLCLWLYRTHVCFHYYLFSPLQE